MRPPAGNENVTLLADEVELRSTLKRELDQSAVGYSPVKSNLPKYEIAEDVAVETASAADSKIFNFDI